MNRRKFIQLGVVGTGAIVAGVEPLSADPAAAAKPATTVPMPISIAPLARQDLDTLFADMLERAGVNALFPFMYTHEPHRAGVSSVNFHGGNYARPHMQFYKDTPLTFDDMHAPEFGGVDVLQRVIPVAQSFSPFQRAEENLADLAACSDFIRPALYNNAAGGRFVRFVNGARAGVWGDCASAEACKVLFDELGYDEAPYDRLAATGFTAGYVERETRRSLASVSGHSVQVWPGVDIDVPVGKGESRCTPQSVALAVKAAFAGGAAGIILSRNYTEMKPEDLSGAGQALRELGVI